MATPGSFFHPLLVYYQFVVQGRGISLCIYTWKIKLTSYPGEFGYKLMHVYKNNIPFFSSFLVGSVWSPLPHLIGQHTKTTKLTLISIGVK